MIDRRTKQYAAWLILAITGLLTPLIAWKVQVALNSNSNDVRDWLPAQYPETAEYKEFFRRFGSEDFVAASWPGCTLDDPLLDRFAERLRTPARQRLIRHVSTGTELARALQEAPLSLSHDAAIGRLKGSIVGSDERATCAVITLTDEGHHYLAAPLAEIREAAKEAGLPAGSLKLGGPPVVNAAINQESSQSLVRLAMLAMGIGLVIAWWCFRDMQLTLMVLAVGLFSATASLAVVTLCGVPLNAILITMAPLVYVSGMSGGIHLLNYYLDAVKEGTLDPVQHAVKHAMLPLALAAGTTAIGLMSLEFADLLPIREFGRFSAIGIVISVIVQFTLLPAYLTLWPPRLKHGSSREGDKSNSLDRSVDSAIRQFATWVIFRRNWFTALFVLLMVVGSYGLARVQTSIEIIRLFSPRTPVLADYAFLEQQLGGLVPMEVILRFDNSSPHSIGSRLALMSAIQSDLHTLPSVSGSLSAATFAPPVSGRIRSLTGITLHRRLAKSGYLMVEDKAEYWRISVRVRAEDIDYDLFHEQLAQKIAPEIAAAGMAQEVTTSYTGTVPIIYKARRSLLQGMILGFGTDVLLLVVAAVFATRHWSNGVLLLLGSMFPMVIVFGWMGLAGIVVDVGSVMTPCVALGVTVDDVIHFILWFRRGISSGHRVDDAVLLAYDGCARAMYQSWGVIGLGLSAFALSSFVPTFRFGALMIALLTVGLAGNLIFLPALLSGPLGQWIARAVRRQHPTVDVPEHKSLN
ncbi:efflux RND transporter permease subunit [Anatilimnocola floriformis]|uniref:efflux RND transporter permease subunit n=1 Tax=Anatilimnocola floriformis TaxID=2948575 RepID=UPI0020C321EC|nr:MMPL family transporter [Anatilimnocola floriformis]